MSEARTPDLRTLHDVPVLVCPADGAPIRNETDAVDLVGTAWYLGARWLAVPVELLDETFFALRTGLAGDLLQKCANYGVGLAVVGDIARHVEGSETLRDFVRECDRGRQCWFVADEAELAARLRA